MSDVRQPIRNDTTDGCTTGPRRDAADQKGILLVSISTRFVHRIIHLLVVGFDRKTTRKTMSIFTCIVAMACILLVLPTEASREYRRPHNRRRCMHNVGRLKWDEGLENDAQAWANRCNIQHSSSGQGENLAWGTTMSYDRAIELWYDEGRSYNYNSNAQDNAGHFTQVVWKNSEKIGCGMARCSFGQFVVCRYWPAGNMIGNYQQNVPPPVKSATECRV